ncbi:C39 family peptidase [Lacticaseibacillus kribbianus]|uniref:C39 family peptidase n=1 Tax=Lacticaseibacillus kribbianus TaxID=2926292 RepID=UPI001CD36A75|nr:C39 family peptidase [Lacticaseibacillus kribbianus]
MNKSRMTGLVAGIALTLLVGAGTQSQLVTASDTVTGTRAVTTAQNATSTKAAPATAARATAPAAMTATAATTEEPQAVTQQLDLLGIVGGANYKLWANVTTWTAAGHVSHDYLGQTVRVTAKVTVPTGGVYLLLQSLSGQSLGYVNAAGVTLTTLNGTNRLGADRYGTVTSSTNYAIWNNGAWETRVTTTKAQQNHTYQLLGLYADDNGSTYYALGKNGAVYGFVNSRALTLAASSVGATQALDRYGTVTSGSYAVWQDLAWSRKLTVSSTMLHKTYHVIGQNIAENGAVYYKLADSNEIFRGYVNAKALTLGNGPQGAYTTQSRWVTMNTKYAIWTSFAWVKAGKQAKSYSGQLLQTRRYYTYVNGTRYDSVYTESGMWVGYVNAAALSPAKSGWRSVGGKLRYLNANTGSYTKTFAVKYYSQLDSRWASRVYSGYRFGPTGCGMASIAMILSGFGKNVTPATAANYANKYGHFDRGAAGSWESDLTSVASHYGVKWTVMSSASQLSSYLKKGYPATMCLDLGSGVRHIVVLHGYANGWTTVSDPYSSLLYSGSHKVTDVWKRLSWRSDNVNMGKSAAVVYIAK